MGSSNLETLRDADKMAEKKYNTAADAYQAALVASSGSVSVHLNDLKAARDEASESWSNAYKRLQKAKHPSH